MMMNSTYLSELTAVFIDEAEEQLQTMDEEILKLEQDGETKETIQSLFRAAHTLKGSSAAMGFEEMKQLTHEMEQILDEVRNHRMQISHEMINLLFKCLDNLRVLKAEFVVGEGISTDITALARELQHFGKEPQSESVSSNNNRLPDSFTSPGINLDVQLKVQEAQEQGLQIFNVQVRLDSECVMKSARAFIIFNQVQAYGEVLQCVPSLEELEEKEELSFDTFGMLLSAKAKDTDVTHAVLSIMDVAAVTVTPISLGDLEVKTVASSPNAKEKRPAADEGKRKNQTIRVDVERLEHLMNLVGELVIDQTRISQVKNVLNQRYTSDDNVDDLELISDHISRVIGELQESVMKARMLPIEQLFNRFPRMVRDLSQKLYKEIDLIVEGQETELDRTVIEEIGDPLIHLIRNAIDHGIEPAEERRQAGKSAKGKLRITAAHVENQVVIIVEDDGAGINPERMRESAVDKGVITAEEAGKLTDKESVHLIFRPGFSTADSVSDVSGRGVGMDIVKNHIEKLNGIIDIETKLGSGTRFKIKLPLTLAIISGLLVKLSGRTFIIPMSNVLEIVRMRPEELQSIKGKSVVVIREQVLPVVRLHEQFGIPQTNLKRKQLPIVVVGTAEKRIALVVDELDGNQEIVIKSLGAYVGKINCISGATILGDGRVALILEVAGVIKLSGRAV